MCQTPEKSKITSFSWNPRPFPAACSCSIQLFEMPEEASLSHHETWARWVFFPQCGQSLKLKGPDSAEVAVFEVPVDSSSLKLDFSFTLEIFGDILLWCCLGITFSVWTWKRLGIRAHLWMWFFVGICSLLSLASSQAWIYAQLFHSSYIFSFRFYLVIWRWLCFCPLPSFGFSLLIVYLLGRHGTAHE